MFGGVVNTGVAAHITAAAAGGPRFNSDLSSTQRKSIENGIWLCQVCAKTVDSDVILYSIDKLNAWKAFAENVASIEQQGFSVVPARSYMTLERKLPKLVGEMRQDLTKSPLVREFIAMSKRVTYNGSAKHIFAYYFEDHEELLNQLKIFIRYGAIFETTFNNVDRFEFEEDFVDYLIGHSSVGAA